MALLKTSLEPAVFFGDLGVLSGPGYHSLGKIAAGRFGTVYRGTLVGDTSQTVVAIKEIEISSVSNGVPSDTIREISLLKELDHVNIVRLLHVTVKPHYVCLVFERFAWDLLYFMTDKRIVKNNITIRNFMYQILSAVAYCHSHKIIHRDLTPSNVLVDYETYNIKLCDFGLARDFAVPLASYTPRTGSRYYRAPEVLFGKGQYTDSIDVWSAGCIFAWMKTGKVLFKTKEKDELLGIFRVLGTPTEETWPGVTKLCDNCTFPRYAPVSLAQKLQGVEPLCVDLISRMLCLDPNERISAADALDHEYFKVDEASSQQPLNFMPMKKGKQKRSIINSMNTVLSSRTPSGKPL